ncbi:MAG TPA: hypothetical protein VME17_12880 [Bryobacteraceae bacterium]|nr:hypothetical protein [Bryobacteraceae bacterium]
MDSTFKPHRPSVNIADPSAPAKAANLQNTYRILLIALIVLAIAVRLFFWIYTQRTWEDALISVQHSENAAAGLGLTHTPSDEPPLHGFTSPLSVLVPLLGELLYRGFGLNFIKLVSALLGGVAVYLGFEICTYLKLPPILALTAAAYLAFEHHQILWGMAGMETEITIVAYLYSFWCFQRRSQLEKGISLGLCLLARPDAAIWVAIACSFELWRSWKAGTWKSMAPLVTGLVCVYGPWIIFTFAYYGSPIPNTVYAKSIGYGGFLPVFETALRQRQFARAAADVFKAVRSGFGPFVTLGLVYGGNGTWFQDLWDRHRIISHCMALLLLPGVLAMFRRRDRNAFLIYAFIATYLAYFTFLVPDIFGWYTPPFTAVAVIGSMYGLGYLIRFIPQRATRTAIAAGFGALYTAAFLIAMPVTMRAEKHVQQYVEVGNREAIGLYLKAISKNGDTIGCEPLGYIGYYSRLEVYDYPGLCNRKVVEFLRRHPDQRNLPSMLKFFHPTFLVLRPWESQSPAHVTWDWIDHDYSLIRVFQVPRKESRQLLFRGSNVDQVFYVFELKSAQARA